jgi:hypothetical protein
MNKRNKLILIIIGIIFILSVIGLIIYSLIPKAYIQFNTAPQQVNISIDNGKKQSIDNSESVLVKPGHHSVTVSRDEFSDYTNTVDVKNSKTVNFLVALKPLTDGANSLLQDSKSQAVVQSFYGNIQQKQAIQITAKYPILSILPMQARLYRLYACPSQKYPNDSLKIAICVDEAQSGLEPFVLKDIQSRGYNLSDYEVIWNVISQ